MASSRCCATHSDIAKVFILKDRFILQGTDTNVTYSIYDIDLTIAFAWSGTNIILVRLLAADPLVTCFKFSMRRFTASRQFSSNQTLQVRTRYNPQNPRCLVLAICEPPPGLADENTYHSLAASSIRQHGVDSMHVRTNTPSALSAPHRCNLCKYTAGTPQSR